MPAVAWWKKVTKSKSIFIFLIISFSICSNQNGESCKLSRSSYFVIFSISISQNSDYIDLIVTPCHIHITNVLRYMCYICTYLNYNGIYDEKICRQSRWKNSTTVYAFCFSFLYRTNFVCPKCTTNVNGRRAYTWKSPSGLRVWDA